MPRHPIAYRPPPKADVQFSAAEELFLRDYSTTLLRVEGAIQAGLVQPEHYDSTQALHVAAERAASDLLRKVEQLGITEVATACGADLLYLLHHLKRVCESEQLHVAIKGIMVLGNLHGVYDRNRQNRGSVKVVIAPPQAPRSVNHIVPGLPFQVQVSEESPRAGEEDAC